MKFEQIRHYEYRDENGKVKYINQYFHGIVSRGIQQARMMKMENFTFTGRTKFLTDEQRKKIEGDR